MRKFFAAIAALFIVFGAAQAAPRAVKSPFRHSASRAYVKKTPARAVRAEAAPAVADLAGLYEWEYCADGWMEIVSKTVTFTAGADGKSFEIKGLWEDCTVTADYNPEDGRLTIPNQLIDEANGIWLRHIEEDPVNDEFVMLDTPYEAYLAGEDFVYEDEFVFGIVGPDDEVLLSAFDSVWFRMLSMDATLWEVLPGEATYTDGWFAAGLETPVDPYQVTAWRNRQNSNLIAIVDPYGPATPFSEYNLDTEGKGFVVVDITDPECVLVKWRIYCGMEMDVEFDEGDVYDTRFYPYNTEEDYFAGLSRTYDEIKDAFAQNDLALSTYDEATGTITIHNCVWGDQDDKVASYCFDDADTYQTVIKIPSLAAGITDIATDTTAAAPEYYNLQGIRVSQPEAGHLYIKRQGSHATKIRF